MIKNRVVVTGLGVVAPNGIGAEAFWESLVKGKSGIGPITFFDTHGLKSRIAGEVKGFDPQKYIGHHVKPYQLARHTQLALAAAKMALLDACFEPKQHLEDSISVVLGVSTSALDLVEKGVQQWIQKGPQFVTPHAASDSSPQIVTSTIAKIIGNNSQTITISTSCTSGLDAIGSAMDLIRSGKTDIAITGGSDSPITPSAFAAFTAAGLVSCRNDKPSKASRPFDLERDSGVISEGAGIIILENLEHALARGVKPYLEVIGHGTSMDQSEDASASGLENSMRTAIANANKKTYDIHYICAHGAGHPILDRVETAMIKRVFEKRAYSIPISSIKGVMGNPLAAAGPLQVITCALAIKNQLIPPTANYEKPDPECDLDYVPKEARLANISCALINAHGIGGGNSSVVVERVS